MMTFLTRLIRLVKYCSTLFNLTHVKEEAWTRAERAAHLGVIYSSFKYLHFQVPQLQPIKNFTV